MDLLFPAFEPRLHAQPKPLYAALLTDLVRGASDAIDALLLFRGLLEGSHSGPESTGLMAFDAHGGDTGCHLRAGMMLELFTMYRRPWHRGPGSAAPLTPRWMDRTIHALQQTRERAKTVCAQLTRERARPQTLGLGGKEATADRVVRVLGWHDHVLLDSPAHPEWNAHGHSSWAKALSLNTQTLPSDHSASSPASPGSPSSEASFPDWDHNYCPLRTRWDLDDPETLLRLIVFSYALSKYKTFFCAKGTVAARLCPEKAADVGYERVDGYWDFSNKDYKTARVQRIAQELRVLQTWLSDVSCAWLQTLADKSSRSTAMTHLLTGTIQNSSTGLAAAPCYPGYLLLRDELARQRHTLVMIDRHFCPHGIHLNTFLAEMHEDDSGRPEHHLVAPVRWNIKPVSVKALYASPDQALPHVVAMGNSMHGSVTDYSARLSSHYAPDTTTHSLTDLHDDAHCAENTHHIHQFLQADHDRLALSFFAAHKSYAFPLLNAQDETEFVGVKMGHALPGLREQWLNSSEDLGRLGGGRDSLRVFCWQHVFVETKGRLAWTLEKWMRDRDLLPLSVKS